MSSASETDLVELDWGGGCWSRVTFIVGTAQLHTHTQGTPVALPVYSRDITVT
jgi:hypothetical protein